MAKYDWKFATVGGNTRVNITTGEEIAHLGELDQKMWTILSCPTTGLEIPDSTLKLMDFDNDGKIRVNEVVTTAKWLCSLIKNPEVLVEETGSMAIDNFNEENDEAKQMAEVAKKVATGAEISLAEIEAAIAAAAPELKTVELKAVPAAPYDAAVLAAYAEDKAPYDAYFTDLRLEKMGLKKTDPETAPAIKEEAWKEISEKIGAWEAEKAAIEAENAAAQAAVDAENAAATAEATGQFQPIKKFLQLKRDFYTLLKNYVTLQDFYTRDLKAVFQCGTLIIDQRACDLCVRVQDAGAMAAQAGLSGMYLLFCDCVNKPTGKTMSIIAAMTVGDIANLSVGKNAIFYDRNGLDYDAKVTKIIDNPISIKQAFWSPYRKFAEWVTGLVNKSVAEKESKGFEDMKAQATVATEEAKKNAEEKKPAAPAAFDIAKFAGIFAAFGMAIGAIGTALAAVAKGLFALSWWQIILVIVGLLLIISGPSMLMAYFKLRKRNLAPILNANGWAVNAQAIINVPFGATLTDQAHFPMIKMNDPFAEKGMPLWKKCILWLVALVVACGVAMAVAHFCFGWNCSCCQEAETECVEAEAPAEEPVEEETTEATAEEAAAE